MAMYVNPENTEMTVIKSEPVEILTEPDSYELDVENMSVKTEISIENHQETDESIATNLKFDSKNERDDDHVTNLSEIQQANEKDFQWETNMNKKNHGIGPSDHRTSEYGMKVDQNVCEADEARDCGDDLELTVTDHGLLLDCETEKFSEETNDISENSEIDTREAAPDCSGLNETSFYQDSNVHNNPSAVRSNPIIGPNRIHSRQKPFCAMCNKEFYKKGNLERHMILHTGEKPYSCEVCDRRFVSNDNLKRHRMTHTGETPYCEICNKEFSHIRYLNRHMKCHNVSEQEVNDHVTNLLEIQEASEQDKEFETDVNKDSLPMKIYENVYEAGEEICENDAEKTGDIWAHSQMDSRESPSLNGNGQNSDRNQQKKIHTGKKPHICLVCNKGFGHSGHLNEHMRIHTGVKPFSCRFCEKRFGRRFTLNEHLKRHTGEKRFCCEVCDRRFSNISYLKRHMTTHISEEPDYLNSHNCHSGEKPYILGMCDNRKGHEADNDTDGNHDNNPMKFLNSESNLDDHVANPSENHEGDEKCETDVNEQNHDMKTELSVCEGEERDGDDHLKMTDHGPMDLKTVEFSQETEKFSAETNEPSSLDCNSQDRHRKKNTHTREKPYICGMCDKRFGQHSHLNEHMRIHTGERPYVCGICNKRFGQHGHLNEHMRIHTGEKPHICRFCHKRFGRKSALNEHLKTHSVERRYSCKFCDRRFSNISYLKRHMTTHISEKPDYLNSHNCHSGEKPYILGMCDNRKGHEADNEIDGDHDNNPMKFLNSEPNLDDHVANPSENHEGDEKCEMDVNERSHDMKTELSVCEGEERDGDDHLKMTDHGPMDLKTDEFSQETEKFSAETEELSSLDCNSQDSHRKKNTHTREKPYICGMCDKRFGQHSHLNEHMRIHTGERPYVCGICNKRFGQHGHLNEHMRIHTGEKPHICRFCHKRFGRKSALNEHLKTHSVERRYSCKFCDRRFTNDSYLRRHTMIHISEKPYSCELCDKRFASNDSLKGHMLSHTGEKPYCCEVCNKQFAVRRALNRHMKRHSGEKPYNSGMRDEHIRQNGDLDLEANDEIDDDHDDNQDDNPMKFLNIEPQLKDHVTNSSESQETNVDGEKIEIDVRKRSHPVNMIVRRAEEEMDCDDVCEESGDIWKNNQTDPIESISSCNNENGNVNERIQTGEKPFICGICNKRYGQHGHLNEHMRTHTGERPYVCEFCDKGFGRRHTLNEHLKTHSVEKTCCCQVCDKRFTNESYLKRHMITHLREKPYSCEVCEKQFAESRTLKKHMTRHK